MKLEDCQKEVDAWIRQHPEGYWNPHQIFTRLGSEVGEFGKEILHEFGPLPKKPGEKPSSSLEEAGDIIFTVICFLNSQHKSLEEAFRMAMAKCYGRDKDRFARTPEHEPTVNIRCSPEDLCSICRGITTALPCKHEWMVDGDRDVCKHCGTRSNPVI